MLATIERVANEPFLRGFEQAEPGDSAGVG